MSPILLPKAQAHFFFVTGSMGADSDCVRFNATGTATELTFELFVIRRKDPPFVEATCKLAALETL